MSREDVLLSFLLIREIIAWIIVADSELEIPMNSMIAGLADRIASLVPSVLPQRDAEAACKSHCLTPSSCNAGFFFTKSRFRVCGSHATFEGCCG